MELDEPQRRQLLDNGLRLIVSASEPLYSDIPRTWIKDLQHPAEHIHMLGQTETSGIIAINRISERDIEGEIRPVSIGAAIDDTEILILDHHQVPVADGETGEMYVTGKGVGRGYLNRHDLTAEKFVDLAVDGRPSARYCRTGDFARLAPDGRLECVGRNDFQLKIRGNRIELGEIESILLAQKSVQNCVVIGREDNGGELRLVAYIVANETSGLADELRSASNMALPDYMRPSAYVFLEKLPLTPNGKVDRRALPVPEPMVAQDNFDLDDLPSNSEVVATLARIWSEVLGVQRICPEDDFFALGGHSLMAGRLISRVRSKLGIQTPIRSIFEAPSFRAFCEVVEQTCLNSIQTVENKVAARPEHLPLSFAQQRIWFLVRWTRG